MKTSRTRHNKKPTNKTFLQPNLHLSLSSLSHKPPRDTLHNQSRPLVPPSNAHSKDDAPNGETT
jgi:hypothetical protein